MAIRNTQEARIPTTSVSTSLGMTGGGDYPWPCCFSQTFMTSRWGRSFTSRT